MGRPKGSLNKKRPEPKPVQEKHQTIKELKVIAAERNIKLKHNANYDEIIKALGLEFTLPSRYDHCKTKKLCQVVIKTNVNTGEETKYKSIFEMAKSFGLFAGSITYRLRKNKTIVFDGVEYSLRKE